MTPKTAPSAGSRKGAPNRSPSDARRKTRRALAKAVATADLIQGTSKKRRFTRAAGEANAATGLDTDLRHLYSVFGEDRRDVFATGRVPDGTPFKGRTWRAS